MNIVHLCDCMDFMKDKPDNYYDLAIIDPPYGIFSKITKNKMNFLRGQAFKLKQECNKWDIAPTKKYFILLLKISKNQIIWGGNYFLDFIGSMKGLIVGNKLNPGLPFADGENGELL